MTQASPEDIRKKYDTHAIQYVRQHEERLYWNQVSFEKAAAYLEKNPTDLVLDIGCGSGFQTRRLAGRFPRTQFIGVDFSKELIRFAQASDPMANTRFLTEDLTVWGKKYLEEKPFEGKTVLCLATGILEHYSPEDPLARALRDLWRQVPKGALIVTFHNASLLGRPIFKNKSKCYWNSEQAKAFFIKEGDAVRVSYRFFVLSDVLAAAGVRLDSLLLAIDRGISMLPSFLAKKLTTLLELTLQR